MFPIFAMLILALYIASIIGMVYAIYSPFKSRSNQTAPLGLQFGITDILAISLPLQFALAAMGYAYRGMGWKLGNIVGVAIGLLLLLAIPSFYGIRILQRFKIKTRSKRFVLLGILMPVGGIVCTLAFPIIASSRNQADLVCRVVGLLICTWALRQLSLWVRGNNKAVSPLG